jgi:hypothetical protein
MKKSYFANRRDFLKTAGAAGIAVASPYVITSDALGNDQREAASERIVLGGIGIGNQGSGDQNGFLGRGNVQYVAVCDVVGGKRDAAKARADKRYKNSDCKAYRDFRDLLARKDIDAVHIATPDHWHSIVAISACRAGKDVFCQKPETRTLREGPLMVAAARRYSRVFSGGSQRVLEDYRKTVDACWDGKLGAIKEVNVNLGPLSKQCYLGGEKVPADVDWDMWLGPAPWAPYHPNRISGSYNIASGTCWRAWRDYSGGGMTDWGAHHYGGMLFAVGLREKQPEECIYHNEKGREYLSFRYPGGILVHHNHPRLKHLEVVGAPGETLPPKTVPTYKGNGGIQGDFLHCVKTREKPFRDIEYAANTLVLCHMISIAYDLKRSLKWDSAKQEFPGDEEANRFLDRARREPWIL